MGNFTDIKLSRKNLESYVIRNEIFKALSEKLPVFTGKLLDSGCGSMPYKNLIVSQHHIDEYVSLDIETGLNYDNVLPDFFWDGVTMPFADRSFDVVISTEVLEHVYDVEKYLVEVNRVLKPGGKFFFTVPFLMSFHEIPFDYYRYTPYALEKIFKVSGFEQIEIKAMGGYHASLAQMLGLWTNKFLWGKKKKIMQILIKPVIKILYSKDKPPLDFSKTTMVVGLSGLITKPF